VGVRNAREEVHEHVLGLLVERDPLGERRLVAGLREDVEDRGVVEAPLLLRRPEKDAGEVVRVTEVARPPVEVDLRLAVLDTAEVIRGPRCCVRDDLEPGLCQARGERLEVLDRVRHVRTRDARWVPEADLHRELQAGCLEQRLRLRRVIAVLLDGVRVAEEARRLELLRDDAATGIERLDDALPIQTVRDGLPHLQVVHRRNRLVHADDRDIERRAGQELQVAVLLDDGDVLGLDEVVALDLTVLQRLQPGRVVRDRLEDQRAELRLRAPVVRVADERELVATRP
jgi:hypothetical protein